MLSHTAGNTWRRGCRAPRSEVDRYRKYGEEHGHHGAARRNYRYDLTDGECTQRYIAEPAEQADDDHDPYRPFLFPILGHHVDRHAGKVFSVHLPLFLLFVSGPHNFHAF